MHVVDVSLDEMAAANARAEALRVPYEVVIAYYVSEKRLPPTTAAVEAWGNRPPAHPPRRDQGGPWRPVVGPPSGVT